MSAQILDCTPDKFVAMVTMDNLGMLVTPKPPD